MSILFLIGNGFDLSCGMKTRYENVYDSYCKIGESDSEIIRKFKKEISSDYKNWSDFEEGMARYAADLDSEVDFIECIKDFRNYLQKYLKQEENKFIEYVSNNEDIKPLLIEEMRKSVLDYYSKMTPRISNIIKDIHTRSSNNTNFISFNYTNTFDYLINLAFGTEKVFHIHGKLDKYLIMGMDNEKQVNSSYTLTARGKQAFVKTYFNNEFDPNKMRIAKDRIERAEVICAFGLSLGESDLTWRNAILNSLNNLGNHHLFLFDYQLACEQALLENDKLDSELLKRDSILKSWGIQNTEAYINKIHIPCGQKFFNIEEIIKENKKQKGQTV